MQQVLVRRRVPAPAVAVATLLLLLVTLLAPVTAQAAPAVPATPDLPEQIEAYSSYQGGTVCDPVDRPGARQLAALIRRTYGADEVIGIARNACYTTSEHNDGRALDWMNDASSKADRAKVSAFLDWLLAPDQYGNTHAMARRLGVMYVIWNRRIWKSYTQGWSDYTGSVPHTDHVHISLSVDGASGRTSYWTGRPLAGPCTPSFVADPAPAVVTDPMNFVPVPATRVLATRKGVGTVEDSCRLFAPQQYGGLPSRVDAVVTGVGAVPSTGVAAVALQVTMRQPTGASSLTAGPTGGAMPGVRRLSAGLNQTSTASMVLPVGAGGMVSFATSYAATDLDVSVVGYFVDPTAPLSVQRAVAADGGDRLRPVGPTRLLSGDDREVPAGGSRTVDVAGRAGTDPAASAAVVSVTVRAGAGRGALYVYPSGSSRPRQALLEYRRSAQTVQATVPLGADGALVVESSGRSARAVDVDLVGTYQPQALPDGLGFAARRVPKTVLSTAGDVGLRRLDGGRVRTLALGSAVPEGTKAVLLQVTLRDPSAATALSLWAGDPTPPGTTDLSAGAGRTVTALLVAPLDPAGRVNLAATAGSDLDVKATLVGTFR